jgi:hypothetical protein
VKDGSLPDDQIERIGSTLMALESRMAEHFGLEPEDLSRQEQLGLEEAETLLNRAWRVPGRDRAGGRDAGLGRAGHAPARAWP